MTVVQTLSGALFNTSRNMCLAYTDKLESQSVYEEIRSRQPLTKFTYHSPTFKDPLQQQIHFYGNIFGNKCYPDEGPL